MSELKPGILIAGRYRIEGVLGFGSFGITYEAFDEIVKERVAIKELFDPNICVRKGSYVHPRSSSEKDFKKQFSELKRTFIKEAKIMKALKHPAIVKYLHVLESYNTVYIIMEFLYGRTLARILKERHFLPPVLALEWAEKVCEGLQVMHASHVLHRDIKPSNIFVCVDGRVVIIDFGAARSYSSRTERMTIILTPGYAPPEQYQSRGRWGPYTDLYALGATLYHMTTGEIPPKSLELFDTPLIPPHKLNPSVDRKVSELIMWAMELDVSKRPQTAQEFLTELRKVKASFIPISTAPKYILPPWELSTETMKESEKRSQMKSDNSYEVASSRSLEKRAQNIERVLPQLGHMRGVRTVTFSLDNEYILTGGSDGVIKIWTVRGGRLIHTLTGHIQPITTSALHPMGRLLFTGDEEGTIKIWDFRTGVCLETISAHKKKIRSIAFSGNGSFFLTGSDDATLRLWEYKESQSKCISTLDHEQKPVLCATLSNNSEYGVSGSWDGNIRIWNLKSGGLVSCIPAHMNKIIALAFSEDESFLLSCSSDKTIKIWDLEKQTCSMTSSFDREPITVIRGPHNEFIVALTGKKLRLWTYPSQHIIDLPIEDHGMITNLALSRDKLWLAIAYTDRRVLIWNFHKRRPVFELGGDVSGFHDMTYGRGNGLCFTLHRDRGISLWDVKKGYRKGLISEKLYTAMACSKKGPFVAVGCVDKNVELWDIEKPKIVKTFSGHTHLILTVAMSEDEKYIASGGVDKTIKVWDLENGQLLYTLQGHSGYVRALVFDQDNDRLVSGGSEGVIYIWDLKTGQPVKTFQGHRVDIYTLALNASDGFIASGGNDAIIRIWHPDSGNFVTLHGHKKSVRSIVFSLDGSHIISGSDDSEIKIFHVREKICVMTLKGHHGPIRALALHESGNILFSASLDGTLKIWDLKTGKELAFIVEYDDNEWIFLTTEGYFRASKFGGKYITLWTKNGVVSFPDGRKTYGFLNNPDVIEKFCCFHLTRSI